MSRPYPNCRRRPLSSQLQQGPCIASLSRLQTTSALLPAAAGPMYRVPIPTADDARSPPSCSRAHVSRPYPDCRRRPLSSQLQQGPCIASLSRLQTTPAFLPAAAGPMYRVPIPTADDVRSPPSCSRAHVSRPYPDCRRRPLSSQLQQGPCIASLSRLQTTSALLPAAAGPMCRVPSPTADDVRSPPSCSRAHVSRPYPNCRRRPLSSQLQQGPCIASLAQLQTTSALLPAAAGPMYRVPIPTADDVRSPPSCSRAHVSRPYPNCRRRPLSSQLQQQGPCVASLSQLQTTSHQPRG